MRKDESLGFEWFDAKFNKFILLVLVSAVSVSCNKKSPSEDTSAPTQQSAAADNNDENDNSNSEADDESDTTPAKPARPLAECNGAVWSDYQMSFQTVKNSSTKEYIKEVRHAKLVKFPEAFAGPNKAIAFFRWKVDSGNKASVDAKVLRFDVKDQATSEFVLKDEFVITWSKLADYSKEKDLSAKELFARLVFEIKTLDSSGEYQGIEATVYDLDDKQNYSIKGNMALLNPTFLADPRQYRDGKDSSVPPTMLQYYHPYAKYVEYPYTADEYFQMSQKNCVY